MVFQRFGGRRAMKITLRILLIALLGTAGFMIFNLTKMNTGTIIMCADNDGGIRIPSQVCEYYLHNHRDIKKDVDELASGAGLSFILNGSSKEKKYKIAEFFIENGLDVNGVNHYGDYNLPPIFDAISFNDAELARFLIKHGSVQKSVSFT